MPTIDEFKEQATPPTPLFLFECVLRNGTIERWATHAATVGGEEYAARLLRHNLFELRASTDEGLDGAARISVTLANADSYYSQIERAVGFKGAQVTVRFVFYDLEGDEAESEARVVFRGVADTPDEITESSLRLTFTNRLNLQRIVLPEVRIQRRCPWMFPATAEERQEALDGGTRGKYSPLHRCGYSAGLAGGQGNLDGSEPFTTCDYTRTSCEARGMFALGRFGGIEFVPAQILVRSHGEAGRHLSPVLDNEARYNDSVPLVYGTAWYEPPLVFARNDGNLTHMEVLLGMGEIEEAVKVIVNDVEIPEAVNGLDMTATGWHALVTPGTRSGVQNPDFIDGAGNPLGDPYGSMAMMNVVVPNRIDNGESRPKIRVLVRGLKLERFDTEGASLGESFTNNPAWVLLDVLRRSGWTTDEVDLPSFAQAAAFCAEGVSTTTLYGVATLVPRFQCNLVIRGRRSAAEIARGIRAASSLIVTYNREGKLTLRVEMLISVQQPELPEGGNSASALEGGWPAYEFSDGSAEYSGIVRRENGEPAIRLYSRSGADTPNRLTVEFQDEYNEYQQDSLSLVDIDDVRLTGRELTAAHAALGLPNFDQASRMLDLQLAKAIRGNTFVELETTVRGIGLAPGDLIAVTYLKEGLLRQLFRIVRLEPGLNYQTLVITAQWHDDNWYTLGGASAEGGRRFNGVALGVPRPLVGSELDEHGMAQFGISEEIVLLPEGAFGATLKVEFIAPEKPSETGAQVPLLSLSPDIDTAGGTIEGDQTLYYAIVGKDAQGGSSPLSFTVRAKIPSGGATNRVTLEGLRFSPGTVAFDVYRGWNPVQLLRIAENQAIGTSFTDTGLTAQLYGPPDPHYSHANFYWRWELLGETNVESHSATTVGNAALGLLPDSYAGTWVRITRGTGINQERLIVENTATTVTVSPDWHIDPDSTSYFTIVEGTWKPAGTAFRSPAFINVPGRAGATLEISGRSANAKNEESPYELNPLTRWQIAVGPGADVSTPPKPVFALAPGGKGTVRVAGIGFEDLANTNTIEAATLAMFCWDELAGPTTFTLASAIDDETDTITLNEAGPASVGSILQIEGEILGVQEVSGGGTVYEVARGDHESEPAAHAAGTPVYHLERKITVIPFSRGFFGSPASGSFTYSIFLPDQRIGSALMTMTNSIGTGIAGAGSFGATVDGGLRTLSGGQATLQVQGYLATQNDASPPLVMEETHAVREVFAVVREAPDGGPIEMTIRRDDAVYCELTIDDGETASNVVNGFGVPPLAAGEQLRLDINTVPGAANTLPGRDLTVTIRF